MGHERKYFIFFIFMQTFSLLKAETDTARAATKGGRYLLQDSPMLVIIRIKVSTREKDTLQCVETLTCLFVLKTVLWIFKTLFSFHVYLFLVTSTLIIGN